MSSETGDPRPARLSAMATRPQEPEHLPCPRCDSTNTKFCYYNNYNLSQPRHFCKSCRRYWTRGGTLRNVPVGGGSRKSSSSSPSSSSNKRPRTSSAAASPTATTPTVSSSSDNITTHYDPTLHANPVSMASHMGPMSGQTTGPLMGYEVNLNETVPEASNFSSTFLTTQGLFPFGGGLGPGLHGFGLGLGAMDWPVDVQGNGGAGVVVGGRGGGGGDDGVGDCSAAGGGSSSSVCNETWPMGGGVDGGLEGGDCFGWPELAISMPGKGLK